MGSGEVASPTSLPVFLLPTCWGGTGPGTSAWVQGKITEGIKGAQGVRPRHVPIFLFTLPPRQLLWELPAWALKSDSLNASAHCSLALSERASSSGKMGILGEIKGDNVDNVLGIVYGT